MAVHQHQIEHLGAWKHFHIAIGDLRAEFLVRSEQKLLAGLPAGIKCAGNLRAAERTVGEQSAIFAGERNPLRHALVDDVRADFRKAVHIRLP